MSAEKLNKEVNELQLKEKYLEAINSFATKLFEAQTVEEIVWTVTQNAISKLGYVDCIIYLYDGKKDRLIQAAAYGPKNPEEFEIKAPIELKPDSGIAGSVFSSGKAEIVPDTSLDKRYVVDDEIRYSEIAVPMFYEKQIIGVIDSEHPEKNFFSTNDLEILTTIAAMASTKIAQAKATEQLLKYQENLEQVVRDKTAELQEKNKRLTEQNAEKELLIKEIHHRVKNNMQIMSSLANLQINATQDKRVQFSLKQFASRINSMAIIHEKLYQNSDLEGVSIDFYMEDLINNIIHSYNEVERIQLHLDFDPIQISLDNAIPLGLLVNELTTNSLKHAFSEQKDPAITLTINSHNDYIDFRFNDNGKGIDESSDETESFGRELISILADQIGYDIEEKSADGYQFNMKIEL